MKNILDHNEVNLQAQFKRWKAQSAHLCGSALVMNRDEATGLPTEGYERVPMAQAVQAFFSRVEAGMNDPETTAQRNEFIARAAADPAVKAQLCALRVETYQNYVLAHQNIISFFFEQVQLGTEDVPYAQNETTQEIRVRAIADDSNARRARIIKPQEEEKIPLIWLSTDEIEYTVIDIYKGNVVTAALNTIRLAYDMANQREQRCWDLLNSATAANGGPVFLDTFDTTNGSKVLRNFVPNSRINLANLPQGNDFAVAGNGANTPFRTAVLKSISRYADQWKGVFPEGDLGVTGRILIPGKDIADLGDEVEVGDGNSDTVSDQILTQGYATITYLGRRWTLVPDNTIAPGTCYPEFSRKIGRVYSKPSLDEEITDSSMAQKRRNRESRWMKGPFGAYINVSQLPFVARFKYRD